MRYPSRVSGLPKVKSGWMLTPPCSRTLSQAMMSALHQSTACSAEDSEQGLANCKSPSSLQQALSQGVSLSIFTVTEKSQPEHTSPGAAALSVDDSESASVQPASKQEAQGHETAQTSDRYIMPLLCLPRDESVPAHSNALQSSLSMSSYRNLVECV